MKLYIVILSYILIVNIIAFVTMGMDKRKAQNHKWRIKEKTLFLVAAVGGSIGSILGMKHFKHKTKHKRFIYGLPILLLIQVLLGIVIFFGITQFAL